MAANSQDQTAASVPVAEHENACPECETGTVVQIGPQCRETGHIPYGCDQCRWTS